MGIKSSKLSSPLYSQRLILLSQQSGSFPLVQTGGTYQNVSGVGLSLTITKSGMYRLVCKTHANMDYSATSQNSAVTRLAVNGLAILGTVTQPYKNVSGAIGSFVFPLHIEAPAIALYVGDVITLQGYKTNGDPLSIYSGALYEGYMQAELLSTVIPVSLVDQNAWAAYPMVIGATTTPPTKGTVVTDKAYWRRVGANMEITYTYRQTAAGANGSGTYLFPLPAGYSIDMTHFDAAVASIVGSAACFNGASWFPGFAFAYNAGNLSLMYDAPASAVSSGAMGLGSAANLAITSAVSVPIVGW